MPRRLILVIVALLISAGTFLLIQQWVHGSLGRPTPGAAGRAPAVRAIRVLVARTDLSQGSMLTAESVRWQTWPSDDPVSPYLVQGRWRPEDVVGAVTRANLSAGEPLTATGLARPGERGALAATLTPGNRAITVNVTPASGMAGFVVPGDRVDLILTVSVGSREKDGPTHHVSETVLHDVRVMGLDQTMAVDAKAADKKGDKKDDGPPKTATLEVTPKQAEVVEVAADLGVLSLSLRSLGRADGDSVPNAPTHTWDSEATAGLLGGPPSDRPRRAPTDPRSRVVVVRGDVATEMTMPSHALKLAVTP